MPVGHPSEEESDELHTGKTPAVKIRTLIGHFSSEVFKTIYKKQFMEMCSNNHQ